LNGCWPETTRGNVSYMARDDDIDYTILGLHILEDHGLGFGPMDVAAEWLDHLPFTQVYTAERAAYRNLARGMVAPETASYRNPYREWIGAQIRADMWGYVNPGDPARAVGLAYQDASLSHTQNGIYGELWVAALIAASFTTDDVRRALEISLAYVPPTSRLAEAIRETMAMHASGLDWEQARDAIEDRPYAAYSFVHAVNNAALVTAALLWGDHDFTKTIGLAVQGGWDTDCTGATAGSVFGAMHGTDGLPPHWIDPLHDLIRSSIMGYDRSSPSDLAERTLRIAGTRAS
jgi:ADP-ribosylglycohydrolase